MPTRPNYIAAANAAAAAHHARRAGLEQRTQQQVIGDNSFVNLWLATFHAAKAK